MLGLFCYCNRLLPDSQIRDRGSELPKCITHFQRLPVSLNVTCLPDNKMLLHFALKLCLKPVFFFLCDMLVRPKIYFGSSKKIGMGGGMAGVGISSVENNLFLYKTKEEWRENYLSFVN